MTTEPLAGGNNEEPTRVQGSGVERFALAAVLAVFFLLSASWALLVPVPAGENVRDWLNFNPDEANHLAVIAFMAENGRLPPYEPAYLTSHHPPLYHGLGALVYALVTPWAGPIGSGLVLRFLSCAMGLGTLLLVHRAASHLLSPQAAVLAAGCVAGIPMFMTLSGAINNENLSTLTAAGALGTIVVGMRLGFDWRRTLILALWVSLNAATKITGLGLLPTAMAAIVWSGRRRGAPAAAVAARAALVPCAFALLIGWWFVRNVVLYGDPFRQTAHYALLHASQPGYADFAATLHITPFHYAAVLTKTAWATFWGAFDGMRRPLPAFLYLFAGAIQIAAVAGLARSKLRGELDPAAQRVLALVALFAVLAAAVFFRFNWAHFTPQGRYFFPLLVGFGLVMAAGWSALFPAKRRAAASAVLLAAMLIENIYVVATFSPRGGP